VHTKDFYRKTSKQHPVSQRLAFIRPSLAVPGKAPPKGDQWVHEAKWDGFRIQIVKDGNDVRLYSKGGTEWTKRLPSIADAFVKLPACSAILDGELCFCDERGGPNFITRCEKRSQHQSAWWCLRSI
jgi:ATP-dependent DNA ligase